MCVIHIKRYVHPGGLPRVFESIQLCEHAHGSKPCASRTIRDSGVWTEMQSVSTPDSPAGSLVYDNLPSPASEGPPSTPVLATAGSVNYQLREPPSHRRTHSTRERGHKNFRGYFWDDAEIIVGQDHRGRAAFRRYHKRPHHKAHNSSDDVTVVGVGSRNPMFQESTPPPVVPSDEIASHHYPMPPPPPPPPHPRSPIRPEILSTPTRKNKRRSKTLVMIVPDLENPPSKPSPASANPAVTNQGTPSSTRYPYTELLSSHQKPAYDPPNDDEHWAHVNARDQARRERRQRDAEAEAETKRKQDELERQLAEEAKKRQLAEDAGKRQEEANEEYLAKLEQHRFAAREALRAAARVQRAREAEEAQKRARAEAEAEAKVNADYERRQLNHARTRAKYERRDREERERERQRQANADAEREQRRRERQEIEAREAHKEREAREERERMEHLQRELEWLKRMEDSRRNEREADDDWDRRMREGRDYYRESVGGPGFEGVLLAQQRSREMTGRSEAMQGGSSEARLREQGERVLADARAKALARDLQAKLGLRDDEDRREDYERGGYRR